MLKDCNSFKIVFVYLIHVLFSITFFMYFLQDICSELWRCGCGCLLLCFHFFSLHLSPSLNWQVWPVHLFPLLFCLFLSEGIITAVPEDNHHERLAGEMRMPLQWIQEAVMRQSKLDHLNSRLMKNYVNNHSGKVKRSRMWAPPLRSVQWMIISSVSCSIPPGDHPASIHTLIA